MHGTGDKTGSRKMRLSGILAPVTLLAWLAMALPVVTIVIAGPASAQGLVVRDISVEGNQRIEAATVQSYMVIAPGDSYDDSKVDRSLKALFATGLFADVTIRQQGDLLIVRVVENPIINRLQFEGNHRIRDEQLTKEVQLKPRQVYTRAKVQNDLQRILQIYRRSGRFAATVEPKVIQLEQNRVDLVFEINEGSVTGIRRIRFIGNRKMSDGRLREAISTKESAWYRFLSTDDTYDPDRLTLDREMLRKYYLSRGYADFRVLSGVAELTPERDGFFVTFTLDEGDIYAFGKVDIRSELKGVDPETLRPFITTIEGDTYDASQIDKSIEEMTFELGRQGFAFVEIRPELKRDKDNHVIGMTYVVNESPRVYVERINITGNARTLDKVIRREFRLVEGDAFNTAKVQRSRTRLRGLGFFSKVDITQEKGSAPDKVIINADVQEKSTGELSFGAGYSTSDSLLGDISLRERNLLGTGQDLRVGLTASFRRTQADLAFTDPYFLDREVAAGFDLIARKVDYTNTSGFSQSTKGGGLRATYPITDYLAQQVNYRLRFDRVEDVSPNASQFIREQLGSSTTSSVGYILAYDRRDDRLDPTKGYIIRGGNDYAGLGGTEHFLRTTLNATHYFPIVDQVVLSFAGDAGYVFGINDDVNINNRFFVGADLFRGFKAGGVGPHDSVASNALGSNLYYTLTPELQFPIGLPNEFGIMGRVFSVAGSASRVDVSNTTNLLDSNSLRMSVGTGLSWRSPFGPIRIDLAVPVMKETFDQKELIRFNFGTRF